MTGGMSSGRSGLDSGAGKKQGSEGSYGYLWVYRKSEEGKIGT